MTIRAGNSGNTIVQVKGENMTTKVVLYHHNGKVYGVFKNNKTRTVNVLPDQVREKLRERMRARMEVRNITLDDDGVYQVEAKKNGKLFFIFPVRERVRAQVNAETGEVIRTRTSWWGFLAVDSEDEESLLGASCGTVTPGENDACCQSKNYDYWNSENQECLFNESEE